MAAYAAVVSLQHTINGLRSSRVSSSREILECSHEEASSLLQVLELLNGKNRSRSSMERVDALEAQIRDSAHKLEDFLEFHQLKQLEEEDGDEEGAMREEISSFGETAKRLEQEYLAELSREDDVDYEDATYTDFGVEMIGRSALFNTIIQSHMLPSMRPDDLCLYSFLGEQGSGSRIVVKTLYENAREAEKFERFGWAKVGRGYEVRHVLMSLIAQVEANVDDATLVDATDGQLMEYLYKALENRSFMIVLDGLDDVKLLDSLSFPNESNGSMILITTTSQEVCQFGNLCYNYTMADTYGEDFWLLLRLNVFGWEPIPEELETVGREIAQNCRGRTISFAKTLIVLSKSDKTVEQWSKIAVDKDNPIFTVVDEISEVSEQ